LHILALVNFIVFIHLLWVKAK